MRRACGLNDKPAPKRALQEETYESCHHRPWQGPHGIIASVSNLLYQHGVNILDITQTILSDMFTMIMLVEIGQDSEYNVVRDALLDPGRGK